MRKKREVTENNKEQRPKTKRKEIYKASFFIEALTKKAERI